MSLFDITQVALERALSGASLRNQVLSANVANVNTPGYLPQDVNFHGTLAAALAAGSPGAARFSAAGRGTGPMRADGNGVDIDHESAELAENGLEYQALAAAARTRIEILESAMGAK
jgi:flagellar basal-body rod protein FlgB